MVRTENQPQRPALSASLDHPDDVEACRRGERAALQRVLLTHTGYLSGLIGRIIGQRHETDDVLQQTLIAAVHAFPRYRGEASVRTWLTRIALRSAHAYLRKPERTRRIDIDLDALSSATDSARSAESGIDNQRAVQQLHQHLNAIGPKKRMAFVLHVFEGYPMEEVAALMDAGIPATKSRVFWARRELMRRVQKDPSLRGLLERGTSL